MAFLIVKGAILITLTSQVQVVSNCHNTQEAQAVKELVQMTDSQTDTQLTYWQAFKDTKLSDVTARNTCCQKHFSQSNASTACSDASPGKKH